MTRKQALLQAMELLKKQERTEQISKIIYKLSEIIPEMPITNWIEETIFDTLDQFAIDNGRNPTAADLKKKGLPSHPVIKNRFNMTAKEFLEKYYPKPAAKCESTTYGFKTKEEWLEDFKRHFNIIKPLSADDYNVRRKENTPVWSVVARINGVKSWLSLLDLCGLVPLNRQPSNGKRLKLNYNVVSHIKELDDYNEFERLHRNVRRVSNTI